MQGVLKYFPFIETITTYKKAYFKFDIIAALTVAVVALPQSMAYAIIAGVDPVYGLYSAIVLSILGSLFGNSNHLATGPTNAISLLIASNMSVYAGKPNFYEMLLMLTFLAGAIQFLMGVLKMGKLVNYVSHSVIVGFTAGAGVIIALGQFNQLLGISLAKGGHSTVDKVAATFAHIDQLNYYALGLGLLTIVVSVLSKKINKSLPGALLGLVICVIIVMTCGLEARGIKLTGDIPSAIPPFGMLSFDLQAMGALFNGALVIAIIGLVEAVSISKAISAQSGQKLDSNQEFIGQGVANMGGAFFSCIAGSGSFTRSAITFQNGAVTRLAGVLAGVAVMVILIFFAPFARYIPNAALAGVIMVVAYSMVDKEAVKKVFKSNKNDAAVMLVTFLTTILAPELEYAIYTGILISLLLFLKENGRATVRLFSVLDSNSNRFAESEVSNLSGQAIQSPISIIQLEGNLFFGNSSDLEEKLNQAYGQAGIYIIRFKSVTQLDITSMEVIENFINKVHKQGHKVLLCGIRPKLEEALRKCHITGHVGENNVFIAKSEVFNSLRSSLLQAEAMLRGIILPQVYAAAHPEAADMRTQQTGPNLKLYDNKAAVGATPFKKVVGWMERFLQEPFYQAELFKAELLPKI
ncbi:SulP family inorganic anion transporter [Desulfoscipio sp. XC116]|uniref:SulP family inorganic anion transporter n=1 Tax=Desulfoscipio sp. XC116 TaxID=3144975 RepID=UPI00325AAC71